MRMENLRRGERAMRTQQHEYADGTRLDNRALDTETAIIDCLTDLLHLCDVCKSVRVWQQPGLVCGWRWEDLVRVATGHYEDEAGEEVCGVDATHDPRN